MQSLVRIAVALLASYHALAVPTTPQTRPTVQIVNGTVEGKYVETFDQDHFLGIPFAQPPIGTLRFALPKPVTVAWATPLNATAYSPICINYPLGLSVDPNITYPHSEDCLTINVIRPTGTTCRERLPVLFWIFGGGFREGGSAEGRESDNCRLFQLSSRWLGVLSGESVRGEGSLNAALHDQRLALQWVQDNIEAFGGDPTRVTIQGESAGAGSVGFQLLAYGGRDDGLFSAAIAESGGPYSFASYVSGSQQEDTFQNVLNTANCTNTHNPMACLRAAPFDLLDAAFAQNTFFPVVDGSFITQYSSVALSEGKFVRVPLLMGASTDEGKLFAGLGANSSDVFKRYLSTNSFIATSNVDTINLLLEAYPEQGSQSTHGQSDDTIKLPAPYGDQFARTARFTGDAMFIAGRRHASETWARYGVPVYSYRFDTIPGDVDAVALGATHFQEVSFVFNNVHKTGLDTDPFDITPESRREKYLKLSTLMTRMWTSFVATKSPNNHNVRSFNITWPDYSESASNLVFDAAATSYVEKDDWRSDAIRLLIDRSLDFSR